MRDLDRRQFLRLTAAAAAVPAGAGVLAACGGENAGSENNAGGSGSGGGRMTTPKLAVSSTTQPAYLVQIAGPLLYGADFGLDYSRDDIVVFQSHATAVQAVLSGKVQAVGASTEGILASIAQGAPLRMFQSYSLVGDYVLAGRDPIKQLSDLTSSQARLGIDSPGGAARSAMDAILIAKDTGFLVADLKNPAGLESSGQRTSALASGQVNVTMIHKSQADQVQEQTGGVNILTVMADAVPKYLKECYAAPKKWLNSNGAAATALSASIIKASRELRKSFGAFNDAVHQVMKEPPPKDEIRATFDMLKKYPFWPAEGNGLTKDRVSFMIGLGERENILQKGIVSPEQVMDRGPIESALKKLNG